MTTEFKSNQSPRLPENYAAHVEKVLAPKRVSFWRLVLRFIHFLS